MIRSNAVARFTAPKKIKIDKEPLPKLQKDYALIKYLYCGICGGDYSIFLGRRTTYPVSLGHEFVGEIIDLGENVHNLHCGQIVISDFNYRCGDCDFCRTHKSHLCIYNNIEFFSNRGFANYANIHVNYLVPISPPGYLPRACLIEPLSCVIHACESAHIKSGMHILLCGGGSLGMLFCFYLSRIIGDVFIDLCEIINVRLDLLKKHFPISKYCERGDNSYDLIIDCSNTTSGLEFSLNHAKSGSNLCIMSHLYGLETSFVYELMCKKELHCIFPLRNGKQKNLEQAAQYINYFWESNDDDLLNIYQDISVAFNEKESAPVCKQIISSQAL